jgi:transcriptional regulator with XRE-family HTH domain
MRYRHFVATLSGLIRDLRTRAGLSQRALALRAGTSQPAVARYERGTATPSWETLQRLAAACGCRLRLNAEPLADPHDVELAERLLTLTPEQRLLALPRYARLRGLAMKADGARQ